MMFLQAADGAVDSPVGSTIVDIIFTGEYL